MSWSSVSAFLTLLLEPKPLVILLTLATAVTLPLLLHYVLYRTSSRTSTLPGFLLTGPSGSGKTSLMLMLERGHKVESYTSQVPVTVGASLPTNTKAASAQYRSSNDPSLQIHKRFQIIDTPGHGKLRHYYSDRIVEPNNLRGIIFVVDAADLAPDSDGLRDAAKFLHAILLTLQKRFKKSRTSKAPGGLSLLIAANKADLFTALPAPLVKSTLEKEISRLRSSRAKGLYDSGVGMNDFSAEAEGDWLGGSGDGDFEFTQMAELNVDVQIAAGSVTGANELDITRYWNWFASCL